MLPSFSVAIPCFNEAARIGDTVRATLDYLSVESPDAELIVVN
ncbi:MAG: glycosyl transferase, partial [Verrucomicrobia bacterium]